MSLVTGRVTVRLRRQPKGTWNYKASYLGAGPALPWQQDGEGSPLTNRVSMMRRWLTNGSGPKFTGHLARWDG